MASCACLLPFSAWILALICAIWNGMGFAELLMGLVYMDECPKQPRVPIYLVLNGITMLFIGCLFIVGWFRPRKIILRLLLLLVLLRLPWLIAGSIWTFAIYSNYSDCEKSVYIFTFSILIIHWIILACSLPPIIRKLLSFGSRCSTYSPCLNCYTSSCCFPCVCCSCSYFPCCVCSRCSSCSPCV